MKLKNINGYLVSSINLRESNIDDEKRVIASGLLLPKNKISRNGVMYDWDSVRNTYNQIKGLKLMYNHETEGLDAIPIGHATNAWLKEEDDDDGIAGLYYEADLDPQNPQTRKILRGDLDNVSLQINADEVIPKHDEEFGDYKLAKISDWIEFSVVPTPGMKDATIEARIAEAFKKEKRLKEDNAGNNDFPIDEFELGVSKEKNEHPSLSILEIGQLVLDHLKDNQYYYSSKNNDEEDKKEDINTVTAVGAMQPTKMNNDLDKEEDRMSKTIREENDQITPEVDQVKAPVNNDGVLNEDYIDDMTKVTDALEVLKNEIDSIKSQLLQVKNNDQSTTNQKEDDEAPEDSTDTTARIEEADDSDSTEAPAVAPDQEQKTVASDQTKTVKEDDEVAPVKKADDSDDTDNSDDDEDEEEVEEPIPPITEKSKLNKSLKERHTKTKMSYSEALSSFVKERLRI